MEWIKINYLINIHISFRIRNVKNIKISSKAPYKATWILLVLTFFIMQWEYFKYLISCNGDKSHQSAQYALYYASYSVKSFTVVIFERFCRKQEAYPLLLRTLLLDLLAISTNVIQRTKNFLVHFIFYSLYL